MVVEFGLTDLNSNSIVLRTKPEPVQNALHNQHPNNEEHKRVEAGWIFYIANLPTLHKICPTLVGVKMPFYFLFCP